VVLKSILLSITYIEPSTKMRRLEFLERSDQKSCLCQILLDLCDGVFATVEL
jgi:hypothetical protein